MIRNQVQEALQKALHEKYPKAILRRQIKTAIGKAPDLVLSIAGKGVAFEVKMTNFYDALGRAILWADEFQATYLVIPSQILPSRVTLTRMPPKIGVIAFQVQDRTVSFEVARQSGSHKLSEVTAQIELEAMSITRPLNYARTSLVSPKAMKVVKYLISHRETTQTQIARETDVSIGMVNKVISNLVNRELVSYRGKRLVLFDVWKLLNQVSWNRPIRSLKKGEVHHIDARSTEDMEATLVEVCGQVKVKYALTLFSGAAKYIGYGMRYDSVQVYAEDPSIILERFHATQGTNAGITLEIFAVDNWDIIEEAKPVGGRVVCSPTQLVLDLVSYGGVGRDWAVKLYEATIGKRE